MYTRKDNIKMDIKETGWEVGSCIRFVQDMDIEGIL
jgi:hypothetical protein